MSAANVDRPMSGTDARVREWINSCPFPQPQLLRPPTGRKYSTQSHRSASPGLERKSQVVSPPSVVTHRGVSRYRELIDQANMPGVAITTPHAMAVEVKIEGTEVMVNVSSPTEIRLFAY